MHAGSLSPDQVVPEGEYLEPYEDTASRHCNSHRDTLFGEPLSVPVWPRDDSDDDDNDGNIEMSEVRPAEEHGADGVASDREHPEPTSDEKEPLAQLTRALSTATRRSKGTQKSRRFRGIDPKKDDFDLGTFLDAKRKSAEGAGFEVPKVVLTYKNLEVYGDPVIQPGIATVGQQAWKFFNPLPHLEKLIRTITRTTLPKPIGRQILFPLEGFVKPGEMTLVLGRPGAGCSTLLRTLANVTEGLSQIKGEVHYNGIERVLFKERYSSAIAYSPEDDPHYASLTVRQTLRFALECRVGGVIEGTRRQRIEDTIEVLLRVLGLQNCADTKVGDEMIRGCSGGEKKRVSIAEQLCVQASMGFWDGSSKGLDSSSALDFVRALRTATDMLQAPNVLSLYQASQDIYDLFDRVILISDGHCIYFGPAKAAKPYFESIGFFCPKRKVTPDFLTGITEINERDVKRGWELPIPTTAQEFEQAFRSSDVYKQMENERETLLRDVRAEHRGSVFDKQLTTNKQVLGRHDLLKTQYTTSLLQQFNACVKREVALNKGNVALIGRLVFDTIMAIIVGSAFFKLDNDVPGSFSRGGALFFAILYNCLGAMASVPLVIQGRSVASKHKSYKLYRTYIGPLVMQFCDVPISIGMVIVWSCINYWMVGLRANAGAFFSYLVFLFAANQGFGGLVRIIASLAPNLDVANQVNGIFLLFFIIYTGYIIPPSSMHPWFSWIYWINPLAYGLKSLLENEFDGLSIDCRSAFLPAGPAYAAIPATNKACAAIKGGDPGNPYVDGTRYLQETYGIAEYNRWWNLLILVGFWVLVLIGMMLSAKLVDYAPRKYSVNAWKKARHLACRPGKRAHPPSSGQPGDPGGDLERGGQVAPAPAGQEATDLAAMKGAIKAEDFTWKHINYTVQTKDGPKQLLNDVSGFVRAGQMTALMGSSGAGKTTLIDTITQRKTMGDLNGHIYVGRNPQGNDFKSITAYCEQMDVHNGHCTVREALQFSARLRQPESVPLEEKYAYVETIIKILELEPLANAMIGDVGGGIGISNEQRKRLTIGVELVARPKILFLDEPSSGLDSSASFNIIRLLRALANSGQAVLCTIHQPSAILFQQFDSLLLLARGGRTVYFGELGPDCSTITGYFERQGAYPCPPTANVAEYILDAIGAGTARRDNPKDWHQMWKDSPEYIEMYKDIDGIRLMGDSGAVNVADSKKQKGKENSTQLSTSFVTQLRVVWTRMLVSYWRNPSYNFGRIISQILSALLIGFTFYQLTSSTTDLQNKVFAIFMSMTIGALLINLVQPNYIRNRSWFTRESAAGFYDWKAFAIGITTAELPFATVAATCYFLILYFVAHLNPMSGRAFYFWICWVVYNFFAISLGQMIAAVSPTIQFAAVLNPFFLSMQMLFCGVTVTYNAMPKFWSSWLYHIDPMHYFVEGVIGNELGGQLITCDEDDSTSIIPPSGQTCGAYFAPFFAQGGPGQLASSAASDVCHYCIYKVGDDFTQNLGWSFDHRWRNFGLLVMFWCFNLFMVAMLSRLYRTGR
ncbi:ABC-2 type transporter-domain-containing protein [Powellomyces hirtus]|nr:ABC-2 type transporter-domain-containing protein [Powellomyces hirtus]